MICGHNGAGKLGPQGCGLRLSNIAASAFAQHGKNIIQLRQVEVYLEGEVSTNSLMSRASARFHSFRGPFRNPSQSLDSKPFLLGSGRLHDCSAPHSACWPRNYGFFCISERFKEWPHRVLMIILACDECRLTCEMLTA